MESILDSWANICAESESQGQKLPVIDSLIGATAYEYQLIIVTRNISDYNFSSIQTFSPWD